MSRGLDRLGHLAYYRTISGFFGRQMWRTKETLLYSREYKYRYL